MFLGIKYFIFKNIILFLLAIILCIIIVFPLFSLLKNSLLDADGLFVGLDNFRTYFNDIGSESSAYNSLLISIIVSLATTCLAYPYAYFLVRSCVKAKVFFRLSGIFSILMPSLLPSLGLIYLLGNQGVLRDILLGESVYGYIGIIISSIIYTFPYVLLILMASFENFDARIYESARSLKANGWMIFRCITLPSTYRAIVSAISISFILTFTDFGIPMIIGGSTNILSTDIYKLIIGRFDFGLGSVAAILLMIPTIIFFILDYLAKRKQKDSFSAHSKIFIPQVNFKKDMIAFIYCGFISIIFLGILLMAIYGSLVKFWPYNLTLSFKNYIFGDIEGISWDPIINSLILAFGTAFFGILIALFSSFFVSREIGWKPLREIIHFLCILPVSVPGLVLGLGFVMFVNNPSNPLSAFRDSLLVLMLCSISHLITVPHINHVNALIRIDKEIDMAIRSLKISSLTYARKIILPMIFPIIIDMFSYFFINALTTVSALIFLYSADTKVASVVVISLSENQRIGQATAMAVMIFFMSSIVALLQFGIRRFVIQRSSWRSANSN